MAIKEYVLKGDGVILPSPSKYAMSYEKLDKDSGRNANGDLVRNVLGTKVKIQSIFPMTTNDTEFRTLLNVVLKTDITLEYYDIASDSYKTGHFYCGTPTPDIYTIQNGKLTMKEFAINFIEY